jgi:hypothetical protein
VTHVGQDCHQTFELKPASARVDVAVGEVKADRELRNWPGKQVVSILGAICTEVGGRRLADLGKRECHGFLATLPLVDVLTIVYAWSAKKRKTARTNADIECIHCGKIISTGTELSIGSLPVLYREPWAALPMKKVDLPEPSDLGALGKIGSLWLKCPTWYDSHYDLTVKEFDNDAYRKVALVEAAVCGTDQKEPDRFARPGSGYLMDVESSVLDFLAGEIAEFSGGPIPILPLTCECKGVTPIPFSWRESGAY